MDLSIGPLSQHMLTHIVLMNLVVPLALLPVASRLDSLAPWLQRSWPVATAVQLILLWGWHAPPVLSAAMASPALMAGMHLSLALAAAWFWAAIFASQRTGLWRAVFALLITGKLFCLLGALLVFAPREIYGAVSHAGHAGHAMMADGLGDQQLAGLMMLIACPATYVIAGIWMTARWFSALEARPA